MKRSDTLLSRRIRLGRRALMLAAFQNMAGAATLTTLVNFNNANGAAPQASLVRDSAGNLYGTTYVGGAYGWGTAFKLAPPAPGQTAWTRTTLVNFNSTGGAYPHAGLLRDSGGTLYGTTSIAGGGSAYGTVFKLVPPASGQTAWTRTTLVTFDYDTNGGFLQGNLVRDSAGNLYGTTSQGGAYRDGSGVGYGTVFKLAPPAAGHTAWTLTPLVNFNYTNGAYPYAGLVRDAAGNLYGTTSLGGAYDYGTVFKLAPPASGQTAWTRTTLVNFNGANGANPYAGLVRDSAGNLYGTTSGGGAYQDVYGNGYGTVFKLAPPSAGHTAWTRTTLVNFNGANGAVPYAGLVRDSAGALYGTTMNGGASTNCTLGCGTVFKLAPPATGQTAWTRTTLVNFSGANGTQPYAGLVRDSAGTLYGTTQGGGAGYGTAFKITP
jgi:uncharacterized repeat protein (TIGR03803 family)